MVRGVRARETRMNDACDAPLNEPQVPERLPGAGLEPIGDMPAPFARYLHYEAVRWRPLMRSAGIKAV